MEKKTRDSRGFTLIAALLLTLLLSAMAIGLMYMVNNEQRMGSNDLEGNVAFYGAEAGVETLTAELSQLYQTSQTPDANSINALWQNPMNYPTAVTGSNITSINYTPKIVWPSVMPDGVTPCPNVPNPCGGWDIVGSGQDQGMVASLIPFTLQVTATRQSSAGQVGTNVLAATGASVNLTRTVEVALLPAFEFGVFCDGDCDYFAGPNFNFGGRVHTNGNLFLASGANLTFTDKIAVVGNIVLDRLENGWGTGNGYTGNVWAPNASGGCPNAPAPGPGTTPAYCSQLTAGSWAGGIPTAPPGPPTNPLGNGAANPNWTGISKDPPSGPQANPPGFNSFVVTGTTGATKLQLPFVQSAKVGAIDIIRRPQAGDTALLSGSRLYSEAAIRILLADTQNDLHPERGAINDGEDIQIGISQTGGGGSPTLSAKFNYNGAPGSTYMYFGNAQTGTANGWVAPTNPATGLQYGWSSWPLLGQITTSPANNAGNPAPNAAHAWLRVEYLNNVTGNWTGVTRQWLGYGFGRIYDMPPTAPWQTAAACPVYPALPAGQCYNPISPAILILEQLLSGSGAAAATEATGTDAGGSIYNWIPINFYDAREGEPRDNGAARTSNTANAHNQTVYTPCSPTGVMNSVELDVGNLWLWLQNKGPYSAGSGNLVNATNENGYILYFSDRRGMLPDPSASGVGLYGNITGASGLEDTINSASVPGIPDNQLEPAVYYGISPEDVDADGIFDTYGQKNLAAGVGLTGALTRQLYFPSPANLATNYLNQVNCSMDYENNAGVHAFTVYVTPTGNPNPAPGSPQNNMVTGPRHSLRLVDGGMDALGNSYLPHPAPGNYGDGFTVASEEPVYVFGDYNSGIADPLWPAGAVGTTPHSAASIIADTVTLLSNPPSAATKPTANVGWTDAESFLFPGDVSNRPGNNSYYRMAIAAGKSIPFPQPAWARAIPLKDFGTDGGMHNFLRYLEDRSDGGAGGTVFYAGSLISMYYSQYNTGVFKCCSVVYNAPVRDYFFDRQFLNPNNLPPGTPMFQDVVSLGYHQNFTPQ